MKKVLAVLALCGFSAIHFSCDTNQGASKPTMKTFPEQYSYMIGLDIGKSLKGLNTEIDQNALLYGITDMLKDRPQIVTTQVLDSIKQAFTMKMQQTQMLKMKESGDKNIKEGEAFLAANKAKTGVVTTASGLQYEVITQGTGPIPKSTDVVKVNYVGKLIDGKEFDSSIKRGQPAVFPVTGVIPGWTEALQLMKVGSKYKLVVPSKLVYGERGASQEIGPNAVLTFEVELLGIEPPQAAKK